MGAPDLTAEDADEAILAVYRDWWETCGAIRGRDGAVISAATTGRAPVMNDLQEQIDDAISWCELNGQPCRLIVLKPRKEGATTALVGKSYHLLRGTEAHLLQIGDQLQTTQTMWDMLRTYGENDGFDGWPGKVKRMTASASAGHAAWTHGSTAWTETAGDKRAGQSKTPTIIHAEEVAHWGRDGAAANASDTMLALLNAIADIPSTYVFVSSTANGTGNWYYRTYHGAVSLADRVAGKRGNGWIRIFMPWHKSQWSRTELTPAQADEIEATLTDAEKRGVKLWGWRPDQIAWRREQIASKCDGDEGKFSQEQPPDEVECFLTSGRPVFSVDGMTRLELLARKATPTTGFLERTATGLLFRPDETDGWLVVWELPTIGNSYLASLDTCRHEQADGAKDPDAHSFWMLRASRKNEHGQMENARAACRIRHPCRWDAAVLADKIALVLQWYGRPMLVPEMNAGGEVVDKLRDLGLGGEIYRREKFDRVNPGKTTDVVGWWTDDQTRPLIVTALQVALREENFDLECPVAVNQMRTFVRNARGKAAASSGNHDDDVMALGIGLVCLSDSAKRLMPPAPIAMQQRVQREGVATMGGHSGACT